MRGQVRDRLRAEKQSPLSQFSKLVSCFSGKDYFLLAYRYFVKTDILHHGPDNGETAHLRREGINLIGALSHIAEKAFNGIGRLNMTIHGRWKGIKREEMLFILSQAAYCFGVALSIFRFKRLQIDERIFLLLLVPNSAEFGLDILAFSSRDGTHDVALFVDETAVTRGCRKELPDRCEQSIMSVCDQQIHLCRSSCAHVLQDTEPPLFILLCTGAPRQHFLLPFEIDSQHRQNDARIAFVPMPNLEMDAIQVHHTPMRLQSTLTPGFELLGQRLIQTADGAGTGSNSHQRLSDIPHFMRDFHPQRTSASILRQSVAHSDRSAQRLACGTALSGLAGH